MNQVKNKVSCLNQGQGLKLLSSANLVPGHFSLALEVRQEKALASASHMTTKHPECVGVLN